MIIIIISNIFPTCSCEKGSDCERTIIIKSGVSTIFLSHDSINGRLMVSDETNKANYVLPKTLQNMEINEVSNQWKTHGFR